jgi:hypothetical protein
MTGQPRPTCVCTPGLCHTCLPTCVVALTFDQQHKLCCQPWLPMVCSLLPCTHSGSTELHVVIPATSMSATATGFNAQCFAEETCLLMCPRLLTMYRHVLLCHAAVCCAIVLCCTARSRTLLVSGWMHLLCPAPLCATLETASRYKPAGDIQVSCCMQKSTVIRNVDYRQAKCQVSDGCHDVKE